MVESLDPYTTPAMTAPAGMVSNLDGPYSTDENLVITAAVCLTLTLLAVIARTFAKVYLLKSFRSEDYALIFAEIGFAAFTGLMLGAGHAGHWGQHQWDVSIARFQRVAYLSNILEIIYSPVMFAAKYTILVQVKRIFTTYQKDFVYWAVHTLILANFLGYLTFFITFIFACWPRERIWNHHIPGRCISTNASIVATAAFNLVSDFILLFLPSYALVGLHIPLQKKVGVGAIFATGIFACIAGTIRLVYSIRMTQTHDITWVIAPVGMWALVEFATVILVACFPTFPKLFKYFGKRESTSQYGDGKGPKPAQSGDTKFITAWYKESKKSGLRTYIPLQDRRPGPAVEEMDVHPNASLRRDGGEIHKQVDIRVVSSAV